MNYDSDELDLPDLNSAVHFVYMVNHVFLVYLAVGCGQRNTRLVLPFCK